MAGHGDVLAKPRDKLGGHFILQRLKVDSL
jgi:hypothetical protein